MDASLRAIVWPVMIQMAVLAGALGVILRSPPVPQGSAVRSGSVSSVTTWAGAIILTVGVAVVCAMPAAVALRGAVRGAAAMAERFALWRELAHSFGFALAAALGAMALSALAMRPRRVRWLGAAAVCAPGLLGALVLGLVIQWLAQRSPLGALSDSPVLLVVTLMLLLMPAALVLRVALDRFGAREMLHVAALLSGSGRAEIRAAAVRIWWQIQGRGWFVLAMALFYLAYFEVVASSMLAPVGMPVASVRLHNLMHYGQSPVLSGMMLTMAALPIVIAMVGLMVGRVMCRKFARG
jgi:hypothetical protein